MSASIVDGAPIASIADSEHGIPAEHAAEVFRRFYGLERSLHAAVTGSDYRLRPQ